MLKSKRMSSNSTSVKFGYQARNNNWTYLRLLNIFRVAVSAILFSQSFLATSPLLTIYDLSTFAWTSFGYIVLSLIFLLTSWIDQRSFKTQVQLQTYVDIIAIILIMHACGGVSSGLGIILVISIAITAMLNKDGLAIVFASLASVGLLGEHIYAITYTSYSGTSTQVGLLGIALFATALVTQSLTRRIQSSEALIEQHQLDVANLSALNEQILENMQSGVIALDREDQVRHINDIAINMLQKRFNQYYENLTVPFDAKTVLHDIYQLLEHWRSQDDTQSDYTSQTKLSHDIQLNFHDLHSSSHQGTLIFLDDVSKLAQQMQHSKLVSLGQLTANIAHEIRNPLAAISHAAQLLAENKDLPATENRLTEIINHHSIRINDIIEDIMQISRGGVASHDKINLNEWMQHFIKMFCSSGETTRECFNYNIEPQNLTIEFDSGHLNRIMTNLCANAKAHGNTDQPIFINIFLDANQHINIEVADQGKALDSEARNKIFEPFFTTSHKGSGLGLYIVNQLCEMNNANIRVENNNLGGNSFIISK